MNLLYWGLFFLFHSYAFCQSNINNTFSQKFVIQFLTENLIGISSAEFPGASILNYILFGHKNMTFEVNDYFNSFGIVTLAYHPGNLIIGNDMLLCGFVDFIGENVILPIPLSHVQKVPISSLTKYFQNGFIIKQSKSDPNYIYYTGNVSALYGDYQCNKCLAQILNYEGANIFEINSIFEIIIYNSDLNWTARLTAYIDVYDPITKKGNLKVNSFGFSFKEVNFFDFLLSSPNYENLITFNIDSNNKFNFNGQIVHEEGSNQFYFVTKGILSETNSFS